MRVVIAMMKHETNTFSPVPTPLERFGKDGPAWGLDALAAYAGTATPMGAFIDLARAEGAEIVTPVAAEAWPSGPVDDDAYARLSDAIAEDVAKGCDLVLLDLHGAMVTESHEDGEGELVARLRGLAPTTPIAVALDLHGNLSDRIVDNADVVTGFKTYPHTDMYETGQQAGSIAFRALKGGCRPAMVWGSRPMLPHIMRQGTADAPMHELIAAARRAEEEGALAVSVFGGFPHADIRDAGLSVVAVTDGDHEAAIRIRDEILDQAWSARHDFVYRSEPAAAAVARAARLDQGPVLLLDHCDNCGSGGTQDVTAVLAEILRQGLEDVAAFALHDPAAVAAMAKAGVGAEVTLPLGGKLAMPSIGRAGEPLTVSGRVKLLCDGEFVIRGPMYTGVKVGMGRTAVLDTGKVEIVVIERHHEPWDLGCLRSLGIEPTAKRFIMLKSRVHWRAGFWPVVRHVVECAGVGVTTSDYSALTFSRVRRPIFPLDSDATP
ncbi:MAG: M81 family metallopeptidase [Inquilinus sp.]|nr:M81 family metallopeptidase [Inquilinus sp.]